MRRTIHKGIRWSLLGLAVGLAAPVWADTADEYVAEAQQYMQQGKAKEAVIQLKNALKEDPSNIKARILLGSLYLRTGDAAGAKKELDRAKRLGAPKEEWMPGLAQALTILADYNTLLNEVVPDKSMKPESQATALGMRGNAYLALGDEAKAVAEFDAALAVQSSNPLARLGKARLLLKDGKREEAAAQFTEVLTEYPKHVETRLARGDLLRSLQRNEEAVPDFTVAIEQAPNNPRGYIGRTLAYIALQKSEDAGKDIAELQKRAPNLPIVAYLRALLSFQNKDFEAAGEQLQLVLRASPDNLQAQMLYGIVAYSLKQFTIADDYLSRAVQRVPGSKQLRKLLGAARLKLKDPRRAIEAMEPMLESGAPGDVQTYALLGTAYMLTGNSSKGAELMAKAVELAPDQALLRTQLAAGQLALGDSAAAISQLEDAVSLGQDLVQADVLLVLSYLNQRQYDKAIEAAQALEQRMPESPVPANLSGLAYLAQKKFEPAKQKFQAALGIDPDFMIARMNLARVALVAKKPDQAKAEYEEVLKAAPKHVGAMMGLAALAADRGDSLESERWLIKASEANPNAMQPVLLLAEMHLKRGEALKATNVMAGLSEAQAATPAALRLKGMAQLQSGDFSSARVSFERLVQVQPNAVEGWFQLARAQAASGDTAAAEESFAKAVALDADHKVPLVWIGRGELALRDKRYKEALELSAEMQKFFPNNAMAYEIEAAAHRGLGDIASAIKAVEKAVRAEGSSKRINLFAHTLAASGNTPKAVFMLQEWLDGNPKDGVSWTTLGMMQQQMGQKTQALGAYEKALELTGGNPVVLNNMAWLELEGGNADRAEELAKQAYEIAPERAEIVDTYGWVLFQRGKHSEALNVLQQALVIAPRNAEIGLHVADALHHLGRDDEAKPLLDRILEEHRHTRFAAPARELLKKLKSR